MFWESTLFWSRVQPSSPLPSAPTLSYPPISGHSQEDGQGGKSGEELPYLSQFQHFWGQSALRGQSPGLEPALGGQVLNGYICQQRAFQQKGGGGHFILWWLPLETDPKSQAFSFTVFLRPKHTVNPLEHQALFSRCFQENCGFRKRKAQSLYRFVNIRKCLPNVGPFQTSLWK